MTDLINRLRHQASCLQHGQVEQLDNAVAALHDAVDRIEELEKDADRYDYLLSCDYIAAKKYLPDLDEVEWKAKLRKKHDAAMQAGK